MMLWLFKTQTFPVVVVTEGQCAGQTVADFKKHWKDWPETNVCLNVDALGVLKLIKERLTR